MVILCSDLKVSISSNASAYRPSAIVSSCGTGRFRWPSCLIDRRLIDLSIDWSVSCRKTDERYSNFILWNDKRTSEICDAANASLSLFTIKKLTHIYSRVFANHHFKAISKYKVETTHVSNPLGLWDSIVGCWVLFRGRCSGDTQANGSAEGAGEPAWGARARWCHVRIGGHMDHLQADSRENIRHRRLLCVRNWLLRSVSGKLLAFESLSMISRRLTTVCVDLKDKWSSILCYIFQIPYRILPSVHDSW